MAVRELAKSLSGNSEIRTRIPLLELRAQRAVQRARAGLQHKMSSRL